MLKYLFIFPVLATCIDIAKMLESNYPGVTKKAYIVNAPKIAKVMLATIKPFLSADSASRIKIFDSNKAHWRAALAEQIDPDQIPTYKLSRATC